MVEALIHSTIDALSQPTNRKNGVAKAILEFLQPAFDSDEEYEDVKKDPTSDDHEELIHERLDDYLTGKPDRITKLEDILDRQDLVL